MTRMQRASLLATLACFFLWYAVIATGTRGAWFGVAIAMSVLAFVACAAVLVQAWREAR